MFLQLWLLIGAEICCCMLFNCRNIAVSALGCCSVTASSWKILRPKHIKIGVTRWSLQRCCSSHLQLVCANWSSPFHLWRLTYCQIIILVFKLSIFLYFVWKKNLFYSLLSTCKNLNFFHNDNGPYRWITSARVYWCLSDFKRFVALCQCFFKKLQTK